MCRQSFCPKVLEFLEPLLQLLTKRLEMGITIDAAENVISSVKGKTYSGHIAGSTPRQQTQPPTQAASSLMNGPQTVPTKYSPMDNLLGGGVRRGQVLEISGPPGSPKEALLLKVVSAFVELREEVVFLGRSLRSPFLQPD
jgi:RAD51-like protein 2